ERFVTHPHVRVAELRLPSPDSHLAAERLDTVVCSNVLEHIEDDCGSLDAIRALLQPAGRLALLVPALRVLYGTMDEGLGHVRRYTPGELSQKLGRAGFRLLRLEYF